jgi:capsular polysaccharide biosynthesis protein
VQSISRRKLLVEARRRGWLLIASTVLVALLGWAVSHAITQSSEAETVLVVKAGGPLADQPDASTKLAATYATLIPLDSKIQRAVEAKLGREAEFTTTNDANTAVLRLTFTAPSAAAAIEGSRVTSQTISGPNPSSNVIAPYSVQIARLATSATSSAGSTELVAVGAVLGLILGAVLVAFWRARDPRVDDLTDLRAQLRCPCYELDARTATGVRPFFGAVANLPGQRTVLVPCDPRQVSVADAVCEIVNKAFGQKYVHFVGAPGSEDAGELEAASADANILVLSPGLRTKSLINSIDLLERQHTQIDCAVLVVDRARGATGPWVAEGPQAVR